MSTHRQIEANRRNSQKSTGPTSVTGKAASSMNSLKTGIHANSLVLPSENLADLEQLIEEFYLHHLPNSPDSRCFVDDLIPPSLNPSPQTTSPQIGFVPATPIPAPLQPARQSHPSPGSNPPVPVGARYAHPR